MTFSLTAYDWFVLLCLMFIAQIGVDLLRTLALQIYTVATRKRRYLKFAADFERRSDQMQARRTRRPKDIRRVTDPE